LTTIYFSFDFGGIDLTPLKECKNLSYLDFSSGSTPVGDQGSIPQGVDLRPISEIRKLETLILHGSGFSDLSFLKHRDPSYPPLDLQLPGTAILSNIDGLTNVQTKVLNLMCTRITSISPLWDHRYLSTLNLSYTRVKDISPLAECESLTHLDIDGTNVSDVSVLRRCKMLHTLDLFRTLVTDISGLGHVRKLNLGATPIRDLSPLSGGNIEVLLLDGNNNLKKIGPLKGCKKLYDLNLQALHVQDLEIVSEITSLRILKIDSCGMESIELPSEARGPLPLESAFNKLRKLYLISTDITDVNFLKGCDELEVLSLSKCSQLRTIDHLPKNIRKLNISKTFISNINILSECPNLEKLDITDTHVRDIECLMVHKKLKILKTDLRLARKK